eukprot:gene16093-62486_t
MRTHVGVRGGGTTRPKEDRTGLARQGGDGLRWPRPGWDALPTGPATGGVRAEDPRLAWSRGHKPSFEMKVGQGRA